MSALMASKCLGAGQIIAVDVVEERLNLAKEFGATDVVNSKQTPDFLQSKRWRKLELRRLWTVSGSWKSLKICFNVLGQWIRSNSLPLEGFSTDRERVSRD